MTSWKNAPGLAGFMVPEPCGGWCGVPRGPCGAPDPRAGYTCALPSRCQQRGVRVGLAFCEWMGKVLTQWVWNGMPLEQCVGTKLDLSGPIEDVDITSIPCSGRADQE